MPRYRWPDGQFMSDRAIEMATDRENLRRENDLLKSKLRRTKDWAEHQRHARVTWTCVAAAAWVALTICVAAWMGCRWPM